jgi:hypothetical protein
VDRPQTVGSPPEYDDIRLVPCTDLLSQPQWSSVLNQTFSTSTVRRLQTSTPTYFRIWPQSIAKAFVLKDIQKKGGTWSLRPETPQGSQIVVPRIRSLTAGRYSILSRSSRHLSSSSLSFSLHILSQPALYHATSTTFRYAQNFIDYSCYGWSIDGGCQRSRNSDFSKWGHVPVSKY